MANFDPMRTRLKEAFIYLKVERKLDQKAVAVLMNTSETTISRNISAAGDGRINTDFLIRLNNAVGNVFNIQYIIDGSGSLVEDTGQTANKEKGGEESLSDLVARLIDEVESLRNILTTEISSVRNIKAQLHEEREVMQSLTRQLNTVLNKVRGE